MDRTEFKITITPDGPTFYRHKIEIPSDVLRVEFEYEYYPERGKGAFYAEVMSRYRGIKRVLFDILLTFMLPEDAFKRHPDFIFALTAPIYFV